MCVLGGEWAQPMEDVVCRKQIQYSVRVAGLPDKERVVQFSIMLDLL